MSLLGLLSRWSPAECARMCKGRRKRDVLKIEGVKSLLSCGHCPFTKKQKIDPPNKVLRKDFTRRISENIRLKHKILCYQTGDPPPPPLRWQMHWQSGPQVGGNLSTHIPSKVDILCSRHSSKTGGPEGARGFTTEVGKQVVKIEASFSRARRLFVLEEIESHRLLNFKLVGAIWQSGCMVLVSIFQVGSLFKDWRYWSTRRRPLASLGDDDVSHELRSQQWHEDTLHVISRHVSHCSCDRTWVLNLRHLR